MDINLLQTFILVAREKGFRNAAEKHYLTPSAVSSRIRLLEEEIGAKLFERGQFGTRLTLSGQRLLDHAEDMLAAWNRMRRDVAIPDQAEHHLAIGATDTIWQSCLLDALSSMHAQDPALALQMETGTSESLIREVQDGSLDAICLFEPPALPLLQSKKVGEVRLTLVSTDAQMSASHALEQEMVNIDWGRDTESVGAGISSMVRTSVGWLGLQWLLRQGGCAYLPENIILPYLKSGRLFVVPDATPLTRIIHLIYPLQSGHQQEITQLLQTLSEQLERH